MNPSWIRGHIKGFCLAILDCINPPTHSRVRNTSWGKNCRVTASSAPWRPPTPTYIGVTDEIPVRGTCLAWVAHINVYNSTPFSCLSTWAIGDVLHSVKHLWTQLIFEVISREALPDEAVVGNDLRKRSLVTC